MDISNPATHPPAALPAAATLAAAKAGRPTPARHRTHTAALKSIATMNTNTDNTLAKVPEVTLGFWLLKIAATTLGETGGDAVSMSMQLGYLDATFVFIAIFAVCVGAQVRARRFRPALYWATIVATTTLGTTIADFVDRSLGIGYAGGSALLLGLLLASLWLWQRSLGSVAVASVGTPRAEMFYWVTIMFSQTLGTALGDWTSSTADLGYVGAAIVFAVLLSGVAAAYFWTPISRTLLFWAAFVLTRPLGASLGDFLDKPLGAGGLALSRYGASAVLACFMLLMIIFVRQRPARAAH